MTINIEKMRFDMAEQQRWETRKFIVAVIVASAALVGAGVGLGNLIWAHRQPQPIVIQVPQPAKQ